jgi:hypothetical protein
MRGERRGERWGEVFVVGVAADEDVLSLLSDCTGRGEVDGESSKVTARWGEGVMGWRCWGGAGNGQGSVLR